MRRSSLVYRPRIRRGYVGSFSLAIATAAIFQIEESSVYSNEDDYD